MLNAATPGDWHFIDWAKSIIVRRDRLPPELANNYHPSQVQITVATINIKFADGDLIAAAPAIIRQLRADLRAARAEVEAANREVVNRQKAFDLYCSLSDYPAIGTDSKFATTED